MAQKIEILAFEVKHVTSKKEKSKGEQFDIPEAQCVVHTDGEPVKVGVLNLPKDHPKVTKGMYTPTFKIVTGFDGKVFAVIDTLIPVKV